MKKHLVLTLSISFLAIGMINSVVVAESPAPDNQRSQVVAMPQQNLQDQGMTPLLPGQRVVLGIVDEAGNDMVKVRTGDPQAIHLSVKQGKEKGIAPLKKGDHVEITMNADNTVVDYHLAGQPGVHQLLRGRVAKLADDAEWALILTDKGEHLKYSVQGNIRSRLQQFHTTDAPAVFLLGENNDIIDALAG